MADSRAPRKAVKKFLALPFPNHHLDDYIYMDNCDLWLPHCPYSRLQARAIKFSAFLILRLHLIDSDR